MRCLAPHEVLAATSSLWTQLVYIGIQPGYDDNGNEDSREDLELRNCTCGSTLAMARDASGEFAPNRKAA